MEELLRNIAVTVLAAGVTGFFGSAFVKPILFDRLSMYVFCTSAFFAVLAGTFGIGAATAASSSDKAFASLVEQEGVSLPSAAREAFESKADAVFDWSQDLLMLALALSAMTIITGVLQFYVHYTHAGSATEQ